VRRGCPASISARSLVARGAGLTSISHARRPGPSVDGWLAGGSPASRASRSAMSGGGCRQPQTRTCSRCQARRCSNVAFVGIGCPLCQLWFTDKPKVSRRIECRQGRREAARGDDRVSVSDVSRDGDRAIAQLGSQRLDTVGTPSQQRETVAVRSQRAGRGLADARRRARDDGDPPRVLIRAHRVLLSRGRPSPQIPHRVPEDHRADARPATTGAPGCQHEVRCSFRVRAL